MAVAKRVDMRAIISLLIGAALMQAQSALAEDVSLFGVTVGKPIGVPECSRDHVVPSPDQCHFPATSVTAEGPGVWRADHLTLFGPGRQPSWVRLLHIFTDSSSGVVVRVRIVTNGLDGQDDALQALTQKFGKPTSLDAAVATNRLRGAVKVRSARWDDGTRAPLSSLSRAHTTLSTGICVGGSRVSKGRQAEGRAPVVACSAQPSAALMSSSLRGLELVDASTRRGQRLA